MTSGVVLFVFIFFNLVTNHKALSIRLPSSKSISANPEIWLSSLTEVDSLNEIPTEDGFRRQSQFQNEFVFKNGSDYVILDDTDQVVFTCQARYPVMWNIPHIDQIDNIHSYAFETTVKRISDFHQNQAKPINKYFETTLRVHFTYFEFLNVNFTCEVGEVEDYGGNIPPQKSSSIHLFYAGSQAIARQWETINVYVPASKEMDTSGEDTVVFPCRPATPNVTILLEKQIIIKNPKDGNDTEKWIKFKVPSKHVNFDPKKGFILLKEMAGRRSNIFGLYRCIVLDEDQNDNNDNQGDGNDDDSDRDINENQHVYVNVTSTELALNHPEFKNILDLRQNASVTYNQRSFGRYPFPANVSNSDVFCCSGVPGKPPLVYIELCCGNLQCKLLRYSMARRIQERQGESMDYYNQGQRLAEDRDDCSRTNLFGGELLYCKANFIEFADHFVPMFETNLFPMTSRTEKANSNSSIVKYETAETAVTANISEKIFFTVGYPTTTENRIGNRHYSFSASRFPLTSHPFDFDEDYDDVVIHEFGGEFSPRKRNNHSIDIAEYPRDVLYEDETLVVFCLGWKHLYADGVLLSISWRNGTTSVMEGPNPDIIHYMRVYFNERLHTGVYSEDLNYKFGKELLASKDMLSVQCWMPHLNKSGWDTITRNLIVLESLLPQFAEGQGNITEEVVYFYLGEEQGKTLECNVASGAPEPMINVTKDGQEILDRHYFHQFASLFNVTVITNDTKAHEENNSSIILDDDELIKVVISFAKVSHELQGVYQCTAENIRGKVTRTFRVIVTKKRRVLLPVMLGIIILSSVLLIGMGARHWLQQKSVQALRAN